MDRTRAGLFVKEPGCNWIEVNNLLPETLLLSVSDNLLLRVWCHLWQILPVPIL